MIPGIKTITPSYVEQLIDFAPTELIKQSGIGDLQRDGCAALFNMLVRNGIAYLADEVGMGKTYIGLAVMHLLRYQKPDARVLIIAPRRNIQEKWANDLTSFVQQNWQRADHRVKTPQGTPDWPTNTPDRLSDWVVNLYDSNVEPHDTILRMTSFSINADEDDVRRFTEALSNSKLDALSKHPCRKQIDECTTQKELIENVRALINEAAHYDLIIIDEAHNLKHGYQEDMPSSLRNESLFHMFRPDGNAHAPVPWLLMLSATPMENGVPMSLVRQFEVFGRDQDALKSWDEAEPSISVRDLSGKYPAKELKELQRRLIVRRVGEIKLPDSSSLTRNMYRREWRKGGVESHDMPLKSSSMHERLVNGVIQKNVFEMLQRDKGGRFRIGALESFEIYAGSESSLTETDDGSSKAGTVLPDQQLIADLCQSYRKCFSQEVPHPKLNAVSSMLSQKIANREKALVFVRRVATTTDLASRVSSSFDQEIIRRIKESIVQEEWMIVDEIDQAWKKKRTTREFEEFEKEADSLEEDISDEHHEISDEEEDTNVSEVVPSLFTWWFRGGREKLPEYAHLFTGRRLREQLEARFRFSLILEENYVDWILLRPQDCLSRLIEDSNFTEPKVLSGISEFLPNGFQPGTQRNFRRAFHQVQLATLRWMLQQPCYLALHDNLKILVDEIFDNPDNTKSDVRDDVDGIIREMLGQQGIYPSLARCPIDSELYEVVARGVFESQNESASFDFRQALQQREQIRHMQMAAIKHGAPLIDLYLACLEAKQKRISLHGDLDPNRVAKVLVSGWQNWSNQPDPEFNCGLTELIQIRHHFDLIKKLNFPTLDVVKQNRRSLDCPLLEGQEPRSDSQSESRSVRRFLNQEFVGQSPAAAAKGGQSDERRHRITTHFRMPGMPWVVVATNVYEEGVDLHTFCKTVIHHGISHTASSVEQRTGRIDRIGGLVQREVAAMTGAEEFVDAKKIQSFFPYQNDTFEKFQVRRVLTNCNRFLRALHDTDTPVQEEKEVNLADRFDIPPQITELLQSPFTVEGSKWLDGELHVPDKTSDFKQKEYLSEFSILESRLRNKFANFVDSGGQGIERHYEIDGATLRIIPKSDCEGDHLLIELHIEYRQSPIIHSVINAKADGTGWGESAFRYFQSELITH